MKTPLGIILTLLLLISCSDTSDENSSAEITDSDANIQSADGNSQNEDSLSEVQEDAVAEIDPSQASETAVNIAGVGPVTLNFEAGAFDTPLTVAIEKSESITEQYGAYTIEPASPALSILPEDTTVILKKPLELSLPLTTKIADLVASPIEKTAKNLAVLRISSAGMTIIYPVQLVDGVNVKFHSSHFGTFQVVFIEASDAVRASAGSNIMYLASESELPVCDTSKVDFIYYVGATKSLVGCAESSWSVLDLGGVFTRGAKGAAGVAGNAGSTGIEGTSGTGGATGPAGATGDWDKLTQVLPVPTFTTYTSGVDTAVSFSSYATSYPGTLLFYTLDGSDPSVTSFLYTGDFTLSASATVKVFAVNALFNPSSMASTLINTFPPFSFVRAFGASGSGYDQLYAPSGLAFDSTGNIYVGDFHYDRIVKFSNNGTYLSQFGSYGNGDGKFDNPAGIAVDGSGNIYVVDNKNNRIQKFDSGGNYVSQFGSTGSADGQLNAPSNIALDGSGNIYVSDTDNHRVQKFDSSGSYLSQFGSSGSGDGQFSYSAGIDFDSSGNIFVVDSANNRVQKFSNNGTYLSQFGSYGSAAGQHNYPSKMVIDSNDNIYVTDTFNYRIQKFDSSGNYVSAFGSNGTGNGQFESAYGLAIDGLGNLWLSDPSNNRVQVIKPD